jgi:DNA-damage-inducible protein J
MIMSTSNIQVRVDTKLKKQAERILDDMGLDMSTAFRMFVKKLVQMKTIPFKLGNATVDENGFTRAQSRALEKAYRESFDAKNLVGPFNTAEEFIKSLNA